MFTIKTRRARSPESKLSEAFVSLVIFMVTKYFFIRFSPRPQRLGGAIASPCVTGNLKCRLFGSDESVVDEFF
jgi:hypothetical protein